MMHVSGSEESGSDAGELDEEDMLAAMVQSAALRQDQPAAAAGGSDHGAHAHAHSSDADGSGSDEDSLPAEQDRHPGAASTPSDLDAAASADSRGSDIQLQNGTAEPKVPPQGKQGKQAKGKRRGSKKGAAGEAQLPELACSMCSQEFTSRTKLFAHISQTGHARPKAG
jgi:hypothetical protein